MWFEALAGMAITELRGVFGLNVTYNPVTSPAFTNAIVSLPFLALDLFYGLHWTLGFLLNFLWGMVFSQMFNLFYEQMDLALTNGSTAEDGNDAGHMDLQVIRLSNSLMVTHPSFM